MHAKVIHLHVFDRFAIRQFAFLVELENIGPVFLWHLRNESEAQENAPRRETAVYVG